MSNQIVTIVNSSRILKLSIHIKCERYLSEMKNKIQILVISTTFVLTLCLHMTTYAEMYKWIDEEGNTHYSQKPPTGDISAETIAPSYSSASDAAQKEVVDNTKKADKLRDERLKKSEERVKAEQELAKKKEQCAIAKKKQASFERPRVNYVDDEGNRRRGTEEERLEDLAKAKEEVNKFCN